MARRDDDSDDTPKTPSDAYVGLLAIALVSLLAAAVLLYLDFDALDTGTPKPADPQVKLVDTGLNKPGQPAAPAGN
ncbi:MAG: hypothetical protein JNK93_14250 [Planctomycetia bacterium]|nr:hypothetical protein [Planctomycetia bacterium]